MSTRLRVGVIGCGLISQVAHLPALQELSARFEVVHLADASPGLAARLAGRVEGTPAVSDDWKAVADDSSVDAVVVATSGSHGWLVEALLDAGKHVLCEKPLTLSLAEADRIAQAESRSGKRVQVGYMKHHDPLVAKAAEVVAGLTDPRTVRVTVLHPRPDQQTTHLSLLRGGPPIASAIDQATTGERVALEEALGVTTNPIASYYVWALQGSVIHELSILRRLLGRLPATFDYATAEPLGDENEPGSLYATTAITNRLRLTIAWTWLPEFPEYEEEIAVFAGDGRLRLLMAPPYVYGARSVLTVEKVVGGLRQTSLQRGDTVSSFRRQLEAFADLVTGSVTDVPGVAEAREDTVCLQALTVAIAKTAGYTVGGEAAASTS